MEREDGTTCHVSLKTTLSRSSSGDSEPTPSGSGGSLPSRVCQYPCGKSPMPTKMPDTVESQRFRVTVSMRDLGMALRGEENIAKKRK